MTDVTLSPTQKSVLTYSALNTFRNCPRKYRHRYIDCLRPREKADALSFGSVVHGALELWYRSVADPDRLWKVLEFIDQQFPERIGNDAHKAAWQLARAMVTGYARRYDTEDFEVVEVEKAFTGEIRNPDTGRASQTFVMAGKADAIVRRPDGMYLLEHKTASTIDASYLDKLWTDTQIALYSHYLRQLGYSGDSGFLGTLAYNYGIHILNGIAAGTGTITTDYGLKLTAYTTSGTIANRYGIHIGNPTGAGTLTNNYGLYVENQTKGASGNYAVYSAGGVNYFAGNVGIGPSATTPSVPLVVSRTLSADAYSTVLQLSESGNQGNNSLGIDFYFANDVFNGVRLTAQRQGSSAAFDFVVSTKSSSGSLAEAARVTGTGSLLLTAGTASAPALAAAADTNTGIYFPAADNFAVAVNGQRSLWLAISNSVALGNSALISSDNTAANVGIGYYAGSQVVGQVANTFMGTGAGQYVVPSVATSLNTCVGELAGRGAGASGVTYYYNTLIGARSGMVATTAYRLTGVGTFALYQVSTGENNTALGYAAGYSVTTGTGNVFLGALAGYNETGSNKLYIANSTTANPLIGGDFSAGTLALNGAVTINHASASPLIVQANGVTALTIGSDRYATFASRVGIGTSVPDRMLEINAADGNCLRLTYNDNNGSAANYTDFSVNASGYLSVAASGSRYGFGAAPGTFFHVRHGSSGYTADTTLSRLTVESSANAFIQLLTPNSYTSGIIFSDDALSPGYLQYSHSDNVLKLQSAGLIDLASTSGGIRCVGTVFCYGGETVWTPAAGNSNTVTITLATRNHHTLDCSSATGSVTCNLTVPLGPAAGTVIIKQGATARSITWTPSSGTLKWLGLTPVWSGDTNKYRIVSWRWDGTYLFLAATDYDS